MKIERQRTVFLTMVLEASRVALKTRDYGPTGEANIDEIGKTAAFLCQLYPRPFIWDQEEETALVQHRKAFAMMMCAIDVAPEFMTTYLDTILEVLESVRPKRNDGESILWWNLHVLLQERKEAGVDGKPKDPADLRKEGLKNPTRPAATY